ncbi:MAG: histone [Thermoprotei archaeon]|nr:MAG: histone [Thermoprotei archaeon]
MKVRTKALPLAPFERILRAAGAERVSEDAAAALRDLIETIAKRIAEESVSAMRHAKRKTVKKADIEYVKTKLDVIVKAISE